MKIPQIGLETPYLSFRFKFTQLTEPQQFPHKTSSENPQINHWNRLNIFALCCYMTFGGGFPLDIDFPGPFCRATRMCVKVFVKSRENFVYSIYLHTNSVSG